MNSGCTRWWSRSSSGQPSAWCLRRWFRGWRRDRAGQQPCDPTLSGVVRLTLVSHAMTDATSAGRFPADEPLSSLGVRQLSEMAGQFRADVAVCGSELRVRQTAQGLGLRATVEPRLSDLDAGSWRGALLDDIDAADIHLWLTDVTAAPPGGESVADLLARIGDWMRSLTEEGPCRGGHPSLGRAGGDPRRPPRAAEFVLAHRCRADESRCSSPSRRGLDPASVIVERSTGIIANICLMIDINQPPVVVPWNRCQFVCRLSTHGWPLRSTAYQLNVSSPGRLPALAPMYGHSVRSRSIPGIADMMSLTGAAAPVAPDWRAACTRQMSSALPYHSAP